VFILIIITSIKGIHNEYHVYFVLQNVAISKKRVSQS